MKARSWQIVPAGLADIVAIFVKAYQPRWAIVSERERAFVASVATLGNDRWAITLDGRLFGERAELSWRKDGSQVFVVAIANDLSPLPISDADDLALAPGPKSAMLLWGTSEGGLWLEGSIPRPLDYDITAADGSQLAVLVQNLDPTDGSGRLHRYLDIEVRTGAT
jgi:hypothetical protein